MSRGGSSRKVSVLAQTGPSFDLGTASGKLMRTIMAGLAEFQRYVIRQRVKPGHASARARGGRLGRQHGSVRCIGRRKVLALHRRSVLPVIGRNVGLSTNTGYGHRETRERQHCPRWL